MNLLATFILFGTVDSIDTTLAAVELNATTPVHQTSLTIMPVSAFPCTISEGSIFFVVKLYEDKEAEVVCAKE
jgi:hypothetical protein